MNDLPSGPIVPRPAPAGAFDEVMSKARHRRRVRAMTVAGLVASALVLVAVPTVLVRRDNSAPRVQIGVVDSGTAVPSSTVAASTTVPAVPPLGTVEVGGASLASGDLALAQQVHDALAANDQVALDRLLDSQLDPADRANRLRDLADPDVRAAALLALSTHPGATDGFTYPGFMFSCFGTPLAADDGRRLGIAVPPDAGTFDTQYCDLQHEFRGVIVTFDANVGTTRGLTWTGAVRYQP